MQPLPSRSRFVSSHSPAPPASTSPLRFALFLLVFALALPGGAAASEFEHDPALISALSGFGEIPPDEHLDRFEPGLMDRLIAVIEDDDVPRLARLRAITALARYPAEDRAFEFLSAKATDHAEHAQARLAAIGALGVGHSERPETLEVLRSVLEDEDPGLRARAVQAVSHVGGERAHEVLARHRMVERHIVVRRALRGAMESTLERPLPPEGRVGDGARMVPPAAGAEEGGTR